MKTEKERIKTLLVRAEQREYVLLLLLSEAIKHLYIAFLSASPAYSEDFEEEASEKSDEGPQEKVNINF